MATPHDSHASMTSPWEVSPWLRYGGAAIAFFVGSLLLHGLVHGTGIDAAVFALIGHLWNDGALPYRDVFDNKPPMLMAMAALSDGVARLFGADPLSTWRVVAAACSTVIGLSLVAILPTDGVRRSVAVGTGALAVVLFSTPAFSLGGGFSEPPAFAFALIAMLAVTRSGRPVTIAFSGVLSGMAVLTSLMAIPFVIAPILILLTGSAGRRSGLRTLLLFGASAAIPGLVFLGVYAASGALTSLFDALIGYNQVYSSLHCPVERMVGWPCDPGWERSGAIRAFGLPILAGAIVAAIGLLPGGTMRHSVRLRYLAVLIIAVILSLPQIRRAPVDHYLWPVCLALLFPLSAGLERLLTAMRGSTHRRRWYAGLVLVLLLLPIIAWPLNVVQGRVIAAAERDASERAELRTAMDELAPDRPLVVWGSDSTLFFATGRAPAGGLIDIYPLLLPGFADAARFDAACEAIAHDAPVIVEATPDLRLDLDASTPGGLEASWVAPIRALIAERYEAPRAIAGYRLFIPRVLAGSDVSPCGSQG